MLKTALEYEKLVKNNLFSTDKSLFLSWEVSRFMDGARHAPQRQSQRQIKKCHAVTFTASTGAVSRRYVPEELNGVNLWVVRSELDSGLDASQRYVMDGFARVPSFENVVPGLFVKQV